MPEDDRLQKIKFLVDQSKLYAQFSAASIKKDPDSNKDHSNGTSNGTSSGTSSGTSNGSESASTNGKKSTTPKLAADERPSKRQKRSTRAKDQHEITSFFKPPPAKSSEQPKAITVPMHDYQIAALKWLTMSYQNGSNGISADEMGLGKTLEVIAFLAFLLENGVQGPFLVLGPSSTSGNWIVELERFAPSLTYTKYYGSPHQRTQSRHQKNKWGQIIVTTYEIIMADQRYLHNIQWKYIIVDEGHRLKNIDSKLMKTLKKFSSANRMSLTGTPLQNNLTELWALSNFLLPDIFTDLSIFHSWFESGEVTVSKNDEGKLVTSLHDILRPFLLRRLKKDVGLKLPPKREYVIFTGLTDLQQTSYRNFLSGTAREFVTKQILADNQAWKETQKKSRARKPSSEPTASPRSLRRTRRTESKGADNDASESAEGKNGMEKSESAEKLIKQAHQESKTKSFSNLVMQSRLCCDSPYLFWYPEHPKIEATSGKSQSLQQLMVRLRKGNHKVLVFTQFTRMSDILEDWANERKYTYRRSDGSVAQSDRQSMIEEFADPSADIDMFMITTRSGGQGVNLVAADTVISFDSDWNPQQDLQAMDRVHRIGQKHPVLVFRFCAGDTVEQDLLERAATKLELNHLVIESGHFKGPQAAPDHLPSKQTNEEKIEGLEQQLQRHGAKFKGGTTARISDANFKAMLDRSTKAYTDAAKHPQLSDSIFCIKSET